MCTERLVVRDTPVRIKERDPETLRNSCNVPINYLYIYDVMFDGNIYRRQFLNTHL